MDEVCLSKSLKDRSNYISKLQRLTIGKGSKLGKLESALKKLTDTLCLSTKRGKMLKLVLTIIAVIFLSGIISGFIIVNVRSIYQTSSTISSVGTFKAIGVGVYWDNSLTNRVTEINWGLLEPGDKKSFTIYISNEGTAPLTLSMSTSNWNPSSAANYLTLTWSNTGQTINAGVTAQWTLTLTVSESVSGINSFNFDIIAVGSG